MNALDLEYCSAWALYPSILKHRYHFLGVGSVGDRVVVVVVIVYPKEEERKLFFRGVSNECESSMSFTSVLPLWLVLLSNPADATSFSTTEASEALLGWVYIEVSKRGGMKKVVFGDGYGQFWWSYL